MIDLVPSYWQHCIQALRTLSAGSRRSVLDNQLRLILTASEPLPAELPRIWSREFGHPARLINMFGQTETTGIVTVYPIPAVIEDSVKIVHIGRPIANMRAYVLDAKLRPLPIGVPGELCIAGDGVSIGYLNQPELTARTIHCRSVQRIRPRGGCIAPATVRACSPMASSSSWAAPTIR